MKFCVLLSLFLAFAIVLPAMPQETAHESAIDGKWEATQKTTLGEQVTHFEFRNANGEVTGAVIEGKAPPAEIKNGTLAGNKLMFDTMQTMGENVDSVAISWTGTILDNGQSIRFVRVRANGDGGGAIELEAKRVTH